METHDPRKPDGALRSRTKPCEPDEVLRAYRNLTSPASPSEPYGCTKLQKPYQAVRSPVKPCEAFRALCSLTNPYDPHRAGRGPTEPYTHRKILLHKTHACWNRHASICHVVVRRRGNGACLTLACLCSPSTAWSSVCHVVRCMSDSFVAWALCMVI